MMGPGIKGRIADYKIRDQRWRSGMPFELEAREAARFAGMTYAEYLELPGTREVAMLWGDEDCKCDVIVHFREINRFEAVALDLHKRFPKAK
jgi:hypothetical protein